MNTKSKHTPGPWEVKHDPKGMPTVYPVCSGIPWICGFYWPVFDPHERKEESLDNARLIAAAPELLAALEKCAGFISGLHDGTRPSVEVWKAAFEPLTEARAAIAKAKGE